MLAWLSAKAVHRFSKYSWIAPGLSFSMAYLLGAGLPPAFMRLIFGHSCIKSEQILIPPGRACRAAVLLTRTYAGDTEDKPAPDRRSRGHIGTIHRMPGGIAGRAVHP